MSLPPSTFARIQSLISDFCKTRSQLRRKVTNLVSVGHENKAWINLLHTICSSASAYASGVYSPSFSFEGMNDFHNIERGNLLRLPDSLPGRLTSLIAAAALPSLRRGNRL